MSRGVPAGATMEPTMKTPTFTSRAAGHAATAAALIGLSAALLTGCRGDREDKPPRQFFPDMDDSPKWKAQSETEFFPDQRTMRPPVEGAVAYGRWGYNTPELLADEALAEQVLDRADLLAEDDAFYRGRGPDGRYITTIPTDVTPELIARGRERFNIYCAVCHGYTGSGDGMVGQRWTGLTVANFHDPKYTDPNEPDQKSADGYLFNVALDGIIDPNTGAIRMPPYRHALSERDAWAIVAYIRVLQESVPLEQVPDAAARQRLEAQRAALPPAPAGAGGAGATGQTGATGAGGQP